VAISVRAVQGRKLKYGFSLNRSVLDLENSGTIATLCVPNLEPAVTL